MKKLDLTRFNEGLTSEQDREVAQTYIEILRLEKEIAKLKQDNFDKVLEIVKDRKDDNNNYLNLKLIEPTTRKSLDKDKVESKLSEEDFQECFKEIEIKATLRLLK